MASLLTPIKAKSYEALADLALWNLWCTAALSLSTFQPCSSHTGLLAVP